MEPAHRDWQNKSLTPWSRVLPERLTGPQLVKKFPAVRYSIYKCPPPVPILSQITLVHASIQLIASPFYIILQSAFRSSKWSLFPRSPHQNSVYTSPVSHTCQVSCLSNSSWLDHPNTIWWAVQTIQLLVTESSLPCYLVLLTPKYPPQHAILEYRQPIFLLNVRDRVLHPFKTTIGAPIRFSASA